MTFEEQEEKLPKWAKERLKELRQRLQFATEPLTKELAKLRPMVELLKSRNNGLEELLRCAAKGGHLTAQDIMQALEGYELHLLPKEK